MPPIENKVYRCSGGCHEFSSERHAIVKDAAKFIIHTEMRKLLVKWKKDIKEQGLEALRNVYLHEYKLEDDKFDTTDFNNLVIPKF